MALARMSASDRRIIFECLNASVRGPFFSDRDLSVLFGLSRQELLEIAARFPRIDDRDRDVRRAIGHSLLDLRACAHDKTDEWDKWISVSPQTVKRVAGRWRVLLPPIEYESFEVHGPVYIAGRYYRALSYRIRGGGTGITTEVWSEGRWVCSLDGPGRTAILTAVPVCQDEVTRAGIACSPVPPNYDPLALEEAVDEAEWQQETAGARELAAKKGITQEVIDRIIEKGRYPS